MKDLIPEISVVNEGVDCLFDGVVGVIELVSLGVGFPWWRGGLMWFTDVVGVEVVVILDLLCGEDAVAWEVSPMLRQYAADGVSIVDLEQ